MQTRINGLLTCDECGASVEEGAATRHLEWHKLTNEAFEGAAKLLQMLSKEIVQLKHKE